MDVVSEKNFFVLLGLLKSIHGLSIFRPQTFTVSAETEGQTTLNEWVQAINKL